MADNGKHKSGWLFFAYLLGYLLCFAVPDAVLSLLFPLYTQYFVAVAALMMVVIAGIIVSRWWDQPDMADEVKAVLRWLPLFIIWIGFPSDIDAITHGRWRPLGINLLIALFMVVLLYGAFFLGRAISRRRKLKADG